MTRAAFRSAKLPAPPVELEGTAIPDHQDAAGAVAGADELALLRDRLVAAVRAVCPYWMRNQQQDIVQVAMIAVLKQREKLRERHQFPATYLRKAAYTAVVDELRRRRSRGEVPLDSAVDELDQAAASVSPERRCSASEIAAGVRACLSRLAPPRRAAVTLHLLGYRVPQIAEKMGWKRKQADNLVYRGMDNLRDCLRRRGLEP